MARPKSITGPQVDEVVKRYESGEYIKDIAISVGRAAATVSRVLADKQIKIRRGGVSIYEVNSDFFETIDTQKKAYVLGMLYADGYVQNKKPVVVLALVGDSEKKLIEDIKQAISYTGPIKSYVNNSGSVYHRLQVHNLGFYEGLIRQGCYNRKSLTLEFPTLDQVPDYLLSHFVRGYFDGDGSIMFNEVKRKTDCSIVGTKQFCNSLVERVGQHIKSVGNIFKHKPSEGIFYFRISGSFQFERFFTWLYQDAALFLSRKHDIFVRFMERKDEYRRRSCKSKFYGVSVNQKGHISSSIWIAGKHHYVGSFKTEESAAMAYDTFCLANQVNLDRLNFS